MSQVRTLPVEIGANFGPEQDARDIERDNPGVRVTLLGRGPTFGDYSTLEGPQEIVERLLRESWGMEPIEIKRMIKPA